MENSFVKQIFVKNVLSTFNNTSFLDKDNILWKVIDNKLIGKRSVWCYDLKACWLEDTKIKNVKSWWCGENADYNEIFTK